MVRFEQEEQPYPLGSYPNGTGGSLGDALGDLFTTLYDKSGADGDATCAHVLAAVAATALKAERDDVLMTELVRVAAVAGTWYESIRRQRGF